MSQLWHKTASEDESRAFSECFWQKHRADIESGQFWAERINTLKHLPIERLKLALENLPLPAAFRKAAVATRAIIRAKRKVDEQYDQELAQNVRLQRDGADARRRTKITLILLHRSWL